MNLRPLLLALAFASATVVSAQATPFDYVYSTTLVLDSGVDVAGLNGAVLTVTASFDTTQVYGSNFSYPDVVSTGGFYTISGSSLSENNGTFALPATAFYPTYAGLFSDPAGGAIDVTLPSSYDFEIDLYLGASATGSGVVAGDPVNPSDFAPPFGDASQFAVDSVEIYSPSNTSIFTVVPEPSQYGIFIALALTGLAGWRRLSARAA